MIVYNNNSGLTAVYWGTQSIAKVYSGDYLVFPVETPTVIYRWIQTEDTTCIEDN